MPEPKPTIGLLRFRPVLTEKVWGGRKLGRVFGRELPEGKRIGESWEISGLRHALTHVAEGPFRGADLYRLASARGEEVFGQAFAERCADDFPLLVKFIDAADVLSVQVHPGDEYARVKGFPNGKSEAWVVVAADEGACVYRGFAPGVGPKDFRRALDANEPEAVAGCLARIEVSPGDVIDLHAGTVHAIGGGLLLSEIQQSSDVTYRVYDWGRVGLDGKPRALHLDEAWEVMDFTPSGLGKVEGVAGAAPDGCARVVYRDAPPFHLEVAAADGRARFDSPADRFEIVSVLKGRGEFVSPGGEAFDMAPGDSALVPASWDGYEVNPQEPMRWVRSWVV